MAHKGATLRWMGVGASPSAEGSKSVTVNPDAKVVSEGAPEWLVTNGLGGYASGTMTGLVTRRFHGYLVAALPAPRGRTMMLNHLIETISTDEGRARLSEQPDPESQGRAARPVTRVPARTRDAGLDVRAPRSRDRKTHHHAAQAEHRIHHM